MREQYIKQVKKELSVPRKLKNEVLRDLNEAFDSAAEHGETEKQKDNKLIKDLQAWVLSAVLNGRNISRGNVHLVG